VLAAGAAGTAAGTAHLVAHAATKSLLFLVAGALLHMVGSKDLGDLRGAGRRWPLLGVLAVIGFLTLAGVPPLSMWWTKDAVLAGALADSAALYAVGLAAAGVSAVYAGKALVLLLGLPAATPAASSTGRVARAMSVPMLVLAGAAALLAVLAIPPVHEWLTSTVGQSNVDAPNAVEMAVSALLAAAGIVLVSGWRRGELWRPAPLPRLVVASLGRWLDLEAAARLLVVRPVLALARVVARLDGGAEEAALGGSAAMGRAGVAVRERRWSVDGLVEGAARFGIGSATTSGRADTRIVDRLVESLAGAIGWLGRLARRPQTGMVHQYYAQAVTVLAVLAALAVLLAR
jgi:NADH:ubiquinone oxidoreductase subunit 5 (subunit L)/multisubunit Na+/H+ antiporter MnhA subunit